MIIILSVLCYNSFSHGPVQSCSTYQLLFDILALHLLYETPNGTLNNLYIIEMEQKYLHHENQWKLQLKIARKQFISLTFSSITSN